MNRPTMNDPMAAMGDMNMTPVDNLPANAGQTQMSAAGHMITAQRVAVPRDPQRVMQNLKVLCAAAGTDKYVYSWQVKDRQNNRKVTIEGPTIKLALDLARTYGNCYVGIEEVVDADDNWLFKATFTDLETGYTLSRPFQQAKGKNVGEGMRDDTRRRDMVFQMGASKAIRNVVVNALSVFSDFMVEEARTNLLGWVEHNKDKANGYVERVMERFDIEQKRIEATIGRVRDKWTNHDLAKVMMQLRGIDEGMVPVDDAFPALEDADSVMARKEAEPAQQSVEQEPEKKPAAKKKAAAKPAEEPEPEPEPESEPEEPEQEQGAAEEPEAPEDDGDGDPEDDFFGDDEK